MSTRPALMSLLLLGGFYFCTAPLSLAQTPPDYFIRGRVYDESGRSVSEARVCAHPEDYSRVRGVPCATSDNNGNFTIRARPVRYQVFLDKLAAGYVSQALLFFRHPGFSIQEVVVNDNNRTPFVSLSLAPKNGTLVGKGVDESTGRPIENMRFTFRHAANPQICWFKSVKNPTGEFKLPAAHVPFTLTVTAEGYDDWFGLDGSNKDQSIFVPAGTSIEAVFRMRRRAEALNRALSESEKEPLIHLPAPLQLGPADGVQLDYFPRVTKLEWQSVEGAVSYTVEVDFCDGRNRKECVDPQPLSLRMNQSPKGIVGTSYEFTFVGAQPGRWRVWAIDKNGLEGFKSPWRTFVYLK